MCISINQRENYQFLLFARLEHNLLLSDFFLDFWLYSFKIWSALWWLEIALLICPPIKLTCLNLTMLRNQYLTPLGECNTVIIKKLKKLLPLFWILFLSMSMVLMEQLENSALAKKNHKIIISVQEVMRLEDFTNVKKSHESNPLCQS